MSIRKVVQLDEYDYNELVKMASLKEKQIEKQAQKLYEKKGTYRIDIRLEIRDYYNETIEIAPYTNVNNWDEKFPISDADKRKIINYFNERILLVMKRKFGKQIEDKNLYVDKLRQLKIVKTAFIGLTIAGWAIALLVSLL